MARRQLPNGTVTLLFTDIEGSTRLLQRLGDRYSETLRKHRSLLREAFRSHAGVEVDTQGDAFFYAFSKATDAVAAAQAGQTALAMTDVRVRMGLHTGEPLLSDESYTGVDVHRAARICASANGGQILLSASTARLVEADLRDLGEHRLKDIDAAERLYQLGHEDFPPPRTPNFSNLPVTPTPLIGREREREEVTTLLRHHRLVTLVGPGGSGKTRLALHVATTAIEEFSGGVYWVPLATVREPALVEPAIAHAVGVTSGLANHLADRQVLLLLDNVEQVIDAAPGLPELLGSTAGLKLLVTSREPLHLSGEWEYAVLPLPQTDAVALFTERARASKADFVADDAVAEICRRLDGLPLALELAAARVKALTPPQMLQRLNRRLELLTAGARDLPSRQRTMRATVDWSYELLTTEERELLVCLGVFSDGWTLDAAEAVCDANLDTLESLVAKSLVWRLGERFGMLETVREYALERLDAATERENLRTRHARFFLVLAEKGAAEFDRGEQGTWAQRLDIEHDNLRAALEHFTDSGQSSLELRLVALMWKVWFDQGRWQESRRAIEQALASSSGTTPDRVTVMLGAAWTAWRQGDVRTGSSFADESLELSRALDDPPLIARSLRILGTCIGGDDPDRASALTEESAALSESIGDLVGLTAALNNLAMMAIASGNGRRAADMFARALSIARQSGNRRGCCVYLMNLAEAERRLGEFEPARTHLRESFATARELGVREVVVEVLYGLAALASDAGDYESAGALIGAAQREGDFGHVFEDADRDVYEGTMSSIRQGLGSEGMDSAIAAGRVLTLDTVVTYLEKGSGYLTPGRSSQVSQDRSHPE
jgi:predicted ATPase/class 3 adenylate cyclase